MAIYSKLTEWLAKMFVAFLVQNENKIIKKVNGDQERITQHTQYTRSNYITTIQALFALLIQQTRIQIFAVILKQIIDKNI